MRVTTVQILDGVQRYVESEIIGKIPDARKWVVGTYVALAMQPLRQNPASLFSHPMLAPLGHLTSADGTIDIDAVREVLLSQAQKYPSFIDIPLIGRYNVDGSDVDRIYQYIISG